MRRKCFQMQIIFNIFPRISLHCKLVPVQYREYEYGLLMAMEVPSDGILVVVPSIPFKLNGIEST